MAEQNLTDTIDFDRSVLGIDYDVGTHEVTKEQVVAYALALGETNPLYLDEEAAKAGPYGAIIAPPLFYNMFSLQSGPDPKVKFGTPVSTAASTLSSLSPSRPATSSPPRPRSRMCMPRRAAPGQWCSPSDARPSPIRTGRRT